MESYIKWKQPQSLCKIQTIIPNIPADFIETKKKGNVTIFILKLHMEHFILIFKSDKMWSSKISSNSSHISCSD